MLTLGTQFYALLNIYNALTLNLYCSLLFLYNKNFIFCRLPYLMKGERITVFLKSFKIRPVFK